jgi:outer membrane immunogenic protein
MRKLIVGAAAALSFAATSALADGPYRRPPPTIAAPIPEAPPPPSWTGFYLGAGIGAGAMVHEVSINDVDFGRLFSFDGVGGEGVFGTVILGWDWQVGANTVFGVFVDYDFSDISTTISAPDTFRASLDHDNSWAVGARLGWLSNPATLWYLTAGYTEADFNASARVLDKQIFSLDKTFSGYFVGGGVDTRLAGNWFLRLEYRFTEFDSEGRDLDEFTTVDFEPSMHTARLTLTYKFGGGYGWGWGTWGQ